MPRCREASRPVGPFGPEGVPRALQRMSGLPDMRQQNGGGRPVAPKPGQGDGRRYGNTAAPGRKEQGRWRAPADPSPERGGSGAEAPGVGSASKSVFMNRLAGLRGEKRGTRSNDGKAAKPSSKFRSHGENRKKNTGHFDLDQAKGLNIFMDWYSIEPWRTCRHAGGGCLG